MPDVLMPRLSDSMEEATIVTWRVADGARVEVGQELAEVETDKATVGLEAENAGTIKIIVGEGETVSLGVLIATIGEGGQTAGVAAGSTGRSDDPPQAAVVAPEPPLTSQERTGSPRSLASPLARRVASDLGVDLTGMVGTGPRGRIVRSDVEEAARSGSSNGQSTLPAHEGGRSEVTTAKGGVEQVELSRIQQLVARRMAESKATVPDFAVSVDVEMEEAWAVREGLKASAEDGGPVPSLNDLVVLAVGRALREFQRANASYVDGHLEVYDRVNVGVAIADESSLVVATIFDADRKTLAEIARETRTLAAQVRDGSITPPALAGATFTVSNLGMFGVDRFTAVVNPPQAAILAVGAMTPRPVVRDWEIVARRMMSLTLSSDHRVLYGADAAALLARVRQLLENPLSLLAG